MTIKNKAKDPTSTDIEDIRIDEPNVVIDKPVLVNDSIAISLAPIEYRTKKRHLQWFAMLLRNAVVAYLGKTEYKINKCIDYFYNDQTNVEAAVRKSIASATSTGDSCALLADSKKNFYVCALDSNILYDDIHTPDDYSSQYGGLTYLETRGRHYASNLWIKLLVTSDDYILSPVFSEEDFIAGNAYYFRLHTSRKYERDFIIYLISLIKAGKLEEYVKGFRS